MDHPLYHHAVRLAGQPVYAHHVNGRVYHGTITSVTRSGIFLMQHPAGTRVVSGGRDQAPELSHALGGVVVEPAPVYSPAAYFAFGALTGLTAAAVFSPFFW
jgi:hypothetical protein